jgi:hypothetical protein
VLQLYQWQMLFYPPTGKACYLEWQLEKLIAYHFDIIYIYINMHMKNYTKIPHTIQDLENLINIGTVYNMDSIADHQPVMQLEYDFSRF